MRAAEYILNPLGDFQNAQSRRFSVVFPSPAPRIETFKPA